MPFLYRRLVKEDWTLKNWEVIKGPLLWFRGEVPPPPEGQEITVVQDYYRGHLTSDQIADAQVGAAGAPANGAVATGAVNPSEPTGSDIEKVTAVSNNAGSDQGSLNKHDPNVITTTTPLTQLQTARANAMAIPLWTLPGLLARARYYLFRGVDRDVVAEQVSADGKPKGFAASFLARDLDKIHQHTSHYDNKTEHLYSFLQVMTAATASFAHGANDVSNAIGPLAAIYLVWRSGETSSKSPVPIWILIYGGAAISIGLWTYGYNLMINLGNRLTLHSPSRGFSMELGAATTVVLATRLGLPISTTQCITGATVGVGLCSGTLKAINWRMIAWIYFGWIITLPVAGLVSGCLMGFVINAPRWGLPINSL